MLRTVGIVLVLCGAIGFGAGRAVRYYRQAGQLRDLQNALELLRCEMNYTLLPLPKLCDLTAKRVGGAVGEYFAAFGRLLDEGHGRQSASQGAFERTRRLELPPDAEMVLLELCGGIGRYDLEGENRLLRLSAERIEAAVVRTEAEKKPLAKSSVVLGICTGLAIVILAV